MALVSTGCTGIGEYFRNGFKVGPEYCPPPAPVAEHWIDAADKRLDEQPCPDLSRWWTVFNDPVLDRLVTCASQQNLSLREAAFRVLEARAQLGIQVGGLFPQSQTATGSYQRIASPGQFYTDQWRLNFNLAWELDFWGRLRRAIAAADANLEASAADYDQVLITLLADVAQNYVLLRTNQEQIALLRENVKLQQGVLKYIETRFKAGFRVTELDLDQAQSNLAQTQSGIPQRQIQVRQAVTRLCTLLGITQTDLEPLLGEGKIPTVPAKIVVGIPAELLRRRPDVRRVERLTAAQSEQIGIAESDLYPMFTITGTLGWQARDFSKLFSANAFNGNVGPNFQWNLLNYNRIRNNVRAQTAAFQALVAAYQNTVLIANEEVEDGLVTFLRAQERAQLLQESVNAARKAVKIVVLQYEKGAVDFNRYATIEQNLVVQQDLMAQAQGEIAQGLISVYRALGGGWENGPCPEDMIDMGPPVPFAPESVRSPIEEIPAPKPNGAAAKEKPVQPPAVPPRDKLPAIPEPPIPAPEPEKK